MKQAEIVVGTEYVASRRQDYDRYGGYGSTHIRITGPGAKTVEPKRTGYGKRTVTKFPTEIFKDGKWQTGHPVEARHVREEWEQYNDRQVERARSRREDARRQAVAQNERAARLPHIVPALRHAGIVDTRVLISGSSKRIVELLRRHVPDIIEVEYEGNNWVRYAITAPLAQSIEGYVLRGKGWTLGTDELLTAIR